jgi:hypothetical protein
MLDGIDDIEWKRLKHAFGAATDVPAVLRALAAGPDAERRAALVKIASGLVHQGTVYSATIAAMPFLAELATSKKLPERHRANVVHLLAASAPSAPVASGKVKKKPSAAEAAHQSAYAGVFASLVPLLASAKPPTQAALLYFVGEAARRCPKLVPIAQQQKAITKIKNGAKDERLRLAADVALALVAGATEEELARRVDALCKAEPTAEELRQGLEEDEEDDDLLPDAAVVALEGTSQALVSEAK